MKAARRQVAGWMFRTAAGIAACSVSSWASADPYPDHPIRMTVGFPPGTGPDVLARIVGQRLGELVKQTVYVENKPGAGGQIGTQAVAKSLPDGYNLLLAEAGSVSIAPAAFSKLQYDPVKELAAVSEIAWADFVLLVPVGSPYKTLGDMVKANTGKPTTLNFATFGAGSPGHFGAAEFGDKASIKVEPIHYRNTGDAVAAIMAGDVSGAWVSTGVASAQVKGGRARALAITSKERSPLLPEVPTTAEAGIPKLSFSSWLAVLAPAQTPVAVLDTLNQKLVQAMQTPEVKQKLVELGFTVTGTSRSETERMLAAEKVRWTAVVKSTGFKGD